MTIGCFGRTSSRFSKPRGSRSRKASGMEPSETLIRLWIEQGPPGARSQEVWPPRRYRVEDGARVIVSDLPHWWVINRNDGTVRSWEHPQPGVTGPDDVADPWFHFPDVSWLKRWPGVAVRGTTEVVGRAAVVSCDAGGDVRHCPRQRPQRAGARSQSRGVLLRAECFLGDVPLAVEEVVEVTFDAALPSGLFEAPE